MSETPPELDKLPSKTDYYDKFDAPSGSECSSLGHNFQQWESQLKSALSEYHKITDEAEKIAKAYCSACKMKQERKSKPVKATPNLCDQIHFVAARTFVNHPHELKYELVPPSIILPIRSIPSQVGEK
ncbi:KIR protein [Plasmodium coatneyi]|uniref:KIR protein n=1 Tax=Plasmodium coatneyi TaxID=208452 RepID=A0A1B1DSS6_9APIC|nr:KIR protein [Plasmodium coatneyi]ANQ05848.1 KIR protein [Plasmodium coatneyi]